jgi:hypothetical protein
MVVGPGEAEELVWAKVAQVGFSGQEVAHSTDGVFDATLLPGCVRVAEESLQSGLAVEAMVLGELSPVIEG